MAEFLLEIRSQDIPSRLLERLIRGVTVRLFEELTSRGIAFAEMSTAATPRRIALSVRGLADHEPDKETLRLGPPTAEAWDENGAPTSALLDFAAELEVEPEVIEKRSTERGEYAAHANVVEGRAMDAVLESLLPRLLREATAKLPKVGAEVWPRPVTGLVALYGAPGESESSTSTSLDVLPLAFEGFTAGRASAGHPVFSPTSFEVAHWSDYQGKLKDLGLVPGLHERRRELRAALEERAAQLGGEALLEAGQLLRWAATCEIPGLIDGELPPEAFSLPQELLRTVLAERQDAAVIGRGGEILPFFLAVMDRGDDPTGRVRRGRERAVAGDLLDALFDYDRDRKLPLFKRVKRLEQLTFHERLGTWAEKGQRLRALVELACEELAWQEVAEHALEAATLAKADLSTAAVRAYPSLHGVIGGVMARAEGYVEPVWQSIYDQAQPRTSKDALPRRRAGRVLALADRLGSLVGFFGLESETREGRTAPGDPQGLRELATGLLRLIIEGELELDLDLLAARAVLLYGDRLENDAEVILRRLQAFLDRRLDHLLGAEGFGADEIEAAKAVGTGDLPGLKARLEGLRAMRGTDELRQLVASTRRISRMVHGTPEGEIDPSLLAEGAEAELAGALADVAPKVEAAVAEKDYAAVIRELAELAAPLDRFFAEVLVLDEDEARRVHRLALLQSARRLCWRVARLGALDPDAHLGGDSESMQSAHASKVPPWLESRSSKTD